MIMKASGTMKAKRACARFRFMIRFRFTMRTTERVSRNSGVRQRNRAYD
jgi:hypothetical protein